MRIIDSRDRNALARVIAGTRARDAAVARRARTMIAAVRRRGDAALRQYATRFDGLRPRQPLVIERSAFAALSRSVGPDVRRAIRVAAANIERVARAQVPRTWGVRVAPGVRIEHRVSPLARVGCYVPGGRNPLVSSLLMTVIPARVAGVRGIVVACPRPVPAMAYAASVAGATEILCAGGAHAVAALAYGTASVAPVDKIVGPGSAYVAAAKAQVAADCAIDFHAGPTEIVMIADRGNPEWIAADLVAQAEHDPDARAILLTPSRTIARAVASRVRASAAGFGSAAASLRRHGAIVLTTSVRDAAAIADRIAPEHLWCDDERVAAMVRNAGTIFVGATSVPALGDYVTGSNHVLPTAGAARARGGLSAADFVKITTVQRITRAGLRLLSGPGATLARIEGLEGHARSIEVRR